jgi:hypothetical protein
MTMSSEAIRQLEDKLELLGESEVRASLPSGAWGEPGSNMRSKVEDWLHAKEMETVRKMASAARDEANAALSAAATAKEALSIARSVDATAKDALSVAREANAIARSAQRAAWIAAITAILALMTAIAAAVIALIK